MGTNGFGSSGTSSSNGGYESADSKVGSGSIESLDQAFNNSLAKEGLPTFEKFAKFSAFIRMPSVDVLKGFEQQDLVSVIELFRAEKAERFIDVEKGLVDEQKLVDFMNFYGYDAELVFLGMFFKKFFALKQAEGEIKRVRDIYDVVSAHKDDKTETNLNPAKELEKARTVEKSSAEQEKLADELWHSPFSRIFKGQAGKTDYLKAAGYVTAAFLLYQGGKALFNLFTDDVEKSDDKGGFWGFGKKAVLGVLLGGAGIFAVMKGAGALSGVVDTVKGWLGFDISQKVEDAKKTGRDLLDEQYQRMLGINEFTKMSGVEDYKYVKNIEHVRLGKLFEQKAASQSNSIDLNQLPDVKEKDQKYGEQAYIVADFLAKNVDKLEGELKKRTYEGIPFGGIVPYIRVEQAVLLLTTPNLLKDLVLYKSLTDDAKRILKKKYEDTKEALSGYDFGTTAVQFGKAANIPRRVAARHDRRWMSSQDEVRGKYGEGQFRKIEGEKFLEPTAIRTPQQVAPHLAGDKGNLVDEVSDAGKHAGKAKEHAEILGKLEGKAKLRNAYKAPGRWWHTTRGLREDTLEARAKTERLYLQFNQLFEGDEGKKVRQALNLIDKGDFAAAKGLGAELDKFMGLVSNFAVAHGKEIESLSKVSGAFKNKFRLLNKVFTPLGGGLMAITGSVLQVLFKSEMSNWDKTKHVATEAGHFGARVTPGLDMWIDLNEVFSGEDYFNDGQKVNRWLALASLGVDVFSNVGIVAGVLTGGVGSAGAQAAKMGIKGGLVGAAKGLAKGAVKEGGEAISRRAIATEVGGAFVKGSVSSAWTRVGRGLTLGGRSVDDVAQVMVKEGLVKGDDALDQARGIARILQNAGNRQKMLEVVIKKCRKGGWDKFFSKSEDVLGFARAKVASGAEKVAGGGLKLGEGALKYLKNLPENVINVVRYKGGSE